MYEAKNGNLPSTMDVDHARPLDKGGSNSIGNLRARSRHSNRSYQRTRNGGVA